ncbi:S-methyl-5-thioribose-1-phosphate isomerase [Dehalobacter sp. DCM]|uniref:S-methyl-5-thioribose-1-phosphate isomerase n=1 Tax=Dehalobacter sp. DCM TaxID=2907827 RepID=UPI00308141AE|nr:S-methyl-5-thioribose-1-phosphate isomerase [Dehalobacter sp. DCM]
MKALQWQGDHLLILNQTKLPFEEQYREAYSYTDVADAIKGMEVRGAPAIGAAAAFGYALGALKYQGHIDDFKNTMEEVRSTLEGTRPTAVNLSWALNKMEDKFREYNDSQDIETIRTALVKEAEDIAEDDRRMNRLIGEYGNTVVPEKANILTHCNTGSLATVEYGTALGIIRAAHESGKKVHVYAGETRPFLQGARLTVWELVQDQIPMTLITDNMAGYLMQQGKIDMVVVGADRIATNGDTANKIGTYTLAVLAAAHDIPFYIAAPTTTIDLKISSGNEIPIEERDANEVRSIMGVKIVPDDVQVYNPSFDITPSKYISGIITEKGIVTAPYSVNMLKLLVK